MNKMIFLVYIWKGPNTQDWQKEKGAFDKILDVDDLCPSKHLFIGRKRVQSSSLNII